MVITKELDIALCDCRVKIEPEEQNNMGIKMSAVYKNVKKMFDNQVKEESEDDDASYEVRKVQIPKKRIVKILDVNPKGNENEDPDYEEESEKRRIKKKQKSIKKEYTPVPKVKKDIKREDSDSENTSSEDTNYEEEDNENKDPNYEDNENEDPDSEDNENEDPDSEDNENEDPDSEDIENEDPDYEDIENEDPDYEEESEKRRIKKKQKSIKKEYTPVPKVKKNLSAYEQMIQKNREAKMAFLQSIKIEEAKIDLAKSVKEKKKKPIPEKKKKPIPVKRKFKEPPSPPVLRKSRRLANISTDLSEDALYNNALKLAEQTVIKKVIPPVMSFKDALNDHDLYESYIADMSIKEPKCSTEFIKYDKSDLKNLTVSESNIIKITPARITTMTWYPPPEQLIVAAADKYGNLGVLNVSNESSPYLMKIHDEGVTNLQFSPFNHAQLISSSKDGILRCGDMVQHKFNEIYNVSSGIGCTYFDVLSETTFLVARNDGHVAVVDSRINGKSFQKQHACHDYSIKTVNIHPVNRNVFVSAENRGSIRIWDLRKLQKDPVAETNFHSRAVHSAYFSPVTGNSILATSADDKISIFGCSDLSKIMLKQCIKHNNKTGRWLTVFRATWLPYSEEAFVIGSMDLPRKIEVYDKNMFAYSIKHEHLVTITSVNVFHPRSHALASGSSTGKLYVFT